MYFVSARLILPLKVPAPVTSNGLLSTNLVPLCEYVNEAPAPPIVIPAPFAAAESAASVAILKFKSSIDTVVEFMVVCVPST